jgi:uncharacterized damage-inducible protein DinB
MSEFFDVDLKGSRFERVDLSGAQFRVVDLSGAVMRNVDLINVEMNGDIENLVINGVDVGPLIEAALDARYPLRPKMRPTDPDGFREAWNLIEQLWAGTVERARQLPPSLLHESINGEWSFIETLRHLVFATDSWVRRVILGDPSPWDALGLPWDEMRDTPGVPRDRTVRPTLDTMLELRRNRMATVRQVIDGLTTATLDATTTPVDAPGWPPPRSFTVRTCLLIILNEEWHHRLFAERDLDALESDVT